MTSASSPKISVIIPIYKVEKYIKLCLESVLAQTMTDIEIICVNDGSPDRSAEIAREYAAGDSRIKVIDQQNQGLSAARNTGMAAATSPLVMFVDSDDTVDPTFCQKMFDALTDDVDVAICEVLMVPEPGMDFNVTDVDLDYFKLPPRDPKWCNVPAWNKIFRLSVIREHDVKFPPGLKNEDEYFWHAYLPWCRKTAFVTERLYFYLKRPGSIMSEFSVERNGVRSDILRIAALLGDYYERHGLMQNDEWAEHYWRVFDFLVGMAQLYRPERFRFFRLKRKRRPLAATIRRGMGKLHARKLK